MNRRLALKAWRWLPVIWDARPGAPVQLTASTAPAPAIEIHYHLHLPEAGASTAGPRLLEALRVLGAITEEE